MLAFHPAVEPTSIEMTPRHFLHVSKSGGSALKHALGPYARSLNLLLHPHKVRLRDIPDGQQAFFFVRSPLERFVSGFLSRQRQGRPRYYYPWTAEEHAAFTRFPSVNDLAEALSATGPQGAHARQAMEQIRHLARPLTLWLEDEQYLHLRRSDILFVGFQERLENDFFRLRELLGLPEAAVLPTDDVVAHRAPSNSNRLLSKHAEANVHRWYEADFHLYDYCREMFPDSE